MSDDDYSTTTSDNSPDDSYSESQDKSWLDRMGESLKNVVAGLVLFCASFVVLFKNEGCYVTELKTTEEGRGAVVSISPDTIDPANEGKLVHFTGKAAVAGTITDESFGVGGPYVKLIRSVEMYAWSEKRKTETERRIGGGQTEKTTYTYEKAWTTSPESSDQFKKPANHTNPVMPLKSQTVTAKEVTVGVLGLSPNLIEQFSGAKSVQLNADAIMAVKFRYAAPSVKAVKPLPPGAATPGKAQEPPANPTPKTKAQVTAPSADTAQTSPTNPVAAASDIPQIAEGKFFYYGADPAAPQVGDLRVSFEVIEPGEVTVMAAQTANKATAWVASTGSSIETLEVGTHAAAKLLQDRDNRSAAIVWIIRLVGTLMMALGLYLVVAPIETMASVIPFLGDILGLGLGLFAGVVALCLSLMTIATAWLFYRPVIGIPLVVVAVGLIVFFKMRGANATAARGLSESGPKLDKA